MIAAIKKRINRILCWWYGCNPAIQRWEDTRITRAYCTRCHRPLKFTHWFGHNQPAYSNTDMSNLN